MKKAAEKKKAKSTRRTVKKTPKKLSGQALRDEEFRSLNRQLAYLVAQVANCQSYLNWIVTAARGGNVIEVTWNMKERGRVR